MTSAELKGLAYGILIPELPALTLTGGVRKFLQDGGKAALLGETRAEYLARGMSEERRSSETAVMVKELTGEMTDIAGTDLLVAIDQEVTGINRLHDLVSPSPSLDDIHHMESSDIVKLTRRLGEEMLALGVNMNFAPVLDVMTGANGWLDGRHLGGDEKEVARIGSAFVTGMHNAGVVVTAKHFPGHRGSRHDPAVEVGTVAANADGTERDLLPFRAVIDAGVPAVMMGPTIVEAVDPSLPSSRSATSIALLRDKLGFNGLIVTDDLNSASNARDTSVADAAVQALAAGADLLLITGQTSSEGNLDTIVDTIVAAVHAGTVTPARLRAAATAVATAVAAAATRATDSRATDSRAKARHPSG
jgi:beta-N-acetylhexosaminidase